MGHAKAYVSLGWNWAPCVSRKKSECRHTEDGCAISEPEQNDVGKGWTKKALSRDSCHDDRTHACLCMRTCGSGTTHGNGCNDKLITGLYASCNGTKPRNRATGLTGAGSSHPRGVWAPDEEITHLLVQWLQSRNSP